MIFNKVPLEDEGYYVSLDDHSLVVKSGPPSSDEKIWLSKKMCNWIKLNFDLIDFENQKFYPSIKFEGAHNEPQVRT